MKQQQMVVAGAVILGTIAVVSFFVLSKQPKTVAAANLAKPAVAPAPPPAAAPESFVVEPLRPSEQEMKEIRYLPENAALPRTVESRMLESPTLREGRRRLVRVRALTSKAVNGDLLNPQWSPDGLQILATRPGFDGLVVVDVRTGASRRIADVNGYGARWNAEGNIEARDADGNVLVYSPDGTLLSTGKAAAASPATVENDSIYITTADGTRLPITTGEDRYFNPVVSPDGKSVVFEGLTSGLMMAPSDGSAPPRPVGYGNNPVWLPDGSGVVFDMTADDGHVLTEGDIVMVDSRLEEINHLTKGDSLISQRPSVGPNGSAVAFEAEGELYVGELQ